MGELILTGISHGKHDFSLTYPKVDGVEICMAHCKCGYEVQINGYPVSIQKIEIQAKNGKLV
jgi:hypothetical protein